MKICIAQTTSKTLMAAALLSMAHDNATIISSGSHDAYISETTFEIDNSIKSSHKTMGRMWPSLPLSCIGIIWKYFGMQILDKFECIPEYQEIVWRRIDREFITTLDSCTSEAFEFVDCPSLNPEDKMLEEDYLKYMQEQILKHIDFLSSRINAGILEYGTECYVQELLSKKGDKSYIEIDNGFLPWRKKVQEYNRFSQEGYPVKFVVYYLDGEFIAETVDMFSCSAEENAFIRHSDIDKARLISTFQEYLNDSE